jgi:hypothetical protein
VTLPGPFRLSPPGALEAVLRAGFADVEVVPFDFTLAFESADEYIEQRDGSSSALRVAYAAGADRESVHDAIRAQLAPFLVGTRVEMPARALLGMAR